MNYGKILKRSWEILWSYKTLWIFGIIVALTTNTGFNGGGNSSSRRSTGDNNFNFNLPSDIKSNFEELYNTLSKSIFEKDTQTWIWIAVGFVVFIILLSIIFAIGKYVSQTSLIKMVNTFEATGEKVNWRQGFKLGWSRQAWQLFLINLVIFLPLTLLVILFLGCAFMPVLISMAGNNDPTAPGIIASIGLFFLIIFIAIVISVILSLFMEIIYRECVLEGKGVFASIRNGWKRVTRSFKDVFLMWLILIGIRFGYFLVNIPIVILLLGISLLGGGGIGLILFLLLNATGSISGQIVAIVVGLILFMAIFCIPKLFLDGVFETYLSSVWTLTYRELNEMGITPDVLPAPKVDEPKIVENKNDEQTEQELPPAI